MKKRIIYIELAILLLLGIGNLKAEYTTLVENRKSNFSPASEALDAKAIIGKLGVTRGICVVLGDKQCKLALDLARSYCR